MTETDYRTGIIHLMMLLEKHSEEFTTPEQLVALIHEYTELLTTVYSIDTDNDVATMVGIDDMEDDEEVDEDDE